MTIIDRASLTVDGFDKVKKTLEQQTALRGRSKINLQLMLHEPKIISEEKRNQCDNVK